MCVSRVYLMFYPSCGWRQGDIRRGDIIIKVSLPIRLPDCPPTLLQTTKTDAWIQSPIHLPVHPYGQLNQCMYQIAHLHACLPAHPATDNQNRCYPPACPSLRTTKPMHVSDSPSACLPAHTLYRTGLASVCILPKNYKL